LKNPFYNGPQLYAVRTDALTLSGKALLEIMQEVLKKGLPFRFCARGWSMAPFIRDGDIITLSPIQSGSPGIGEIYAFVHPEMGKMVVHRAIAKFDKGLLFQGDSSLGKRDGIIPYGLLLGRVIQIERNKHRISLGLGLERYLIAWLSRIGFLTPIYLWLASLRKGFSKKEQK